MLLGSGSLEGTGYATTEPLWNGKRTVQVRQRGQHQCGCTESQEGSVFPQIHSSVLQVIEAGSWRPRQEPKILRVGLVVDIPPLSHERVGYAKQIARQ